jgi:dipeptidyl aminopeptidase/acylaminoacyl peptidase
MMKRIGWIFLVWSTLVITNANAALFSSDKNNVAKEIAVLREEQDINVWGLDFSPDGKYLAATTPNTISFTSQKIEVHIWDWHKSKTVHVLEKVEGANESLTTEPVKYSPDGRLLAVVIAGAPVM